MNLGTAVLTNKSGGTITGGGIIQNGSQVVNLSGGTILATSTVVELQFTNANTFGNAGTIGASAGATLTFGADPGTGAGALITNYGTINLTGGTLNSGTITNLASGFLGGTGTITPMVVNQGGRVNLGATIANNFLQTAGSFTVSGGATITGLATINGGTLDLVGGRLTDGMLLIAAGATLTNGTLGATLNGGVTNAGTVSFAADVYVLGPVTNTGTWLQRGAISNEVDNAGTLTLMANTVNPRVTGGLVNSGSVVFSNGPGYISGAVTNSGSISFQGAISNNYVQTSGSITLGNNATITGTASISGGNFDLNGKTYTNSQMVVSGGGVLTNSLAGAIFNGGLSNAATVFVSQTTTFNGPVTNTGTVVFQGTINNALINSGSFALDGNATLATAPVNSGTINVAASTLTVNPAWANSGTILIANGTVAGGSLTNNSGATVNGAGTIAPLLVNNGLLVATNGTLTLSVAPQQKGMVNVADGGGPGTLNVTLAWSNSGTVNIASGGVIAGGNFTNLAGGTVTNFGAINTLLVNQGNVVLSGQVSNFQQISGTNIVSGTGTVTGTATLTGGLFDLSGGTYSNGIMIVSGTGVLTNSQANATFNGGLSNAATASFAQNVYFNGPITNTGAFLWQGAISNNLVNAGNGTVTLNNTATITKTVTINGGTFNLNGQIYSNGLMIVDGGTGVLTNAVGGATFNGGLSNAATVAVTASTYFNGPVTNMAAMFFQGAISNTLVNNGSFNLNNTATLTAAPVNNGTINVDGMTLSVTPAWANSGTLLLSGGVLAGGNVTNLASAPISGFGTISNLLVNAGLVTATGGTLTLVNSPTTQAGSGINVAGSGVLNVQPDWSNSGTINIAAGGAVTGGNLTNTSASGTLSGSGFIKAFLVNQGRMNFGGTISNNFLQTAGSFTVSGGATVTGAATINGGTLDLAGGQLTDGMLLIATGATLTNGVQNATLNGGITNAGTVNLFRDTYVNGPVTNTGTWIQRGAISNSVVNSGVMALYTNSINARVTGSIVNTGSLTLDTNGVVYVSGIVSNSGSLAFGDVISNNLVNTAGSITMIGAGTVTGSTMVNGGTFDLNGKSLTDSFLVVSGTGVLTNSLAGAILNGGLSNAATVSFAQSVTLNGPVTNMTAFAWLGTINNSYTQGAGTNLLNGNATITGNTTVSGGLVNLNGKNATFGSLNGGGGTLLNNGNGASVMTVNGGGSYAGTIADHTVGTGTMAVTVGGGVLTLSGNNTYSGGTTINSGGTLKLGSALALGSTADNTVVNSGGVLDLNGQAIGAEPVTLNGTGISSGGALINSSGTGASLGGAITLGSASSIGGSGDMTLSGAIGGGSSLTKVGADTATLTAASGYTGGTVINSGVLNIQNNTALGSTAGGVTVASGAALQLQGGISVGANALSLNGTGISNDGALRNVSGNNSYGGAITLAGASRINSDAGTLTLGGGITGGGSALTIGGTGNVVVAGAIGGTSTTLTKDGTGTLNLTGNNNYTGATTVNGGTLNVNNTSGSGISGGSVAVNSGGVLGGAGTITVGVTINSGGQLAPGNGVGAFNVGALTLASGSIVNFQFNSNPANDLINVLNSGGLTLNGGGFDLYQQGTTTAWTTPGTYNLISYSGTLGGSIGNLSVLNPVADKVYVFGNTGSIITLQIAGGQEWTGLSSNNFWSSGTNWSTATPMAGDLLVFDGTTRINNTNDLAANTQFSGITYEAGAGAFTNNGNAVNLIGDVVNNSTNTQTINLPLVLDSSNRTINAASGAVVINGAISNTNGTWGLIKSGTGTLTLGGSTANTYSGLTTVNAGELDLDKTAGQNAVGGDLSINSGGTVRLLASQQIGDTANVTVNNGGQFNLNGFAETIGGMTNAGTTVVGGGALTVSQTLQNSGTVTLTTGGAIAGGVLSNLTSGLVSGSGFIKSLVVNQGQLNFGGTISNNLLQTAGSFLLGGNATITGNAMLNGGSLDLEGDALTYNSLTISSGAVLQNGGSGAAVMNGSVTNSGLVNFFVSNETTVNGNVVNNGEWDQTGVINGNLVNSGSFTWLTWTFGGSTPLLTGGLVNSGSMALDSTYAEQINGSVTNTGTITLHGTIGGSFVQTAGNFSLDTAGTISGTATVTGGSFDLSGVTYTGSRMIVAGTGVLTNSVAGANFNSGLSNAANVGVTANTFFTGPVTNTGTFAFMGAVSNTLVNSGDVVLNGSGTISGVLANSGSVNVNNGTLSLVVAPTQTGSITIKNGATLNAAQAWVNSGTITLLGGVLTNAVITNADFITGYGTIDGGGVVNNGKIFANASSISGIGTQTVRLTSFTNNNAATLGTASSNAVLNLLQTGNILINQGTVSLSGGTIIFNGGAGTITNFNIIAGVGNVANFPIINAGTLASFVAQAPIPGLSNLIATIGVTNNGLLGANNLINGAATLSLTVSGGGSAIVNQGTVALQGGFLTINGGAGVITNVNSGLIYGVGTQNLSVANLASGTIVASNGIFSLGLQSNANAGLLSNLNATSTIQLTNAFLQNNGTIVLNGGGLLMNGVITNENSITGPGAIVSSLYNDTAGVVLATNGLLNVATVGETVQNLGLFTITSDGTLNVASSWANTNGTVSILGGGLTGGAVTNVGLVSGFGTISSQLVNMGGGTLTASGAGSLTLVAAPTQNGWVNIANAGTLNVQQAWLNSGMVNVQGGSLVGSTVTNSGTIFGSGTITPLVRNNSGGTVTANGGTLTLTVAPSQLGNVIISNAATLNVLQAWQNGGTFNLQGGTAVGSTIANAATITGFGTITPQVQNAGGATVTASGGTLTLAAAPSQLGTFVAANGGTLNVQQAWQNSGLLSMAGGTAIGSTITNAASVNGFGTITPQLVNITGATVTANNGTLTLTVAPSQLGSMVISNAATLNALQAWQNSGSMRMRGGTVIGSGITNAGGIEGFGTINPQVVNNSGATLTADSGLLTLALALMQNGTVIVTNGGTLSVLTAWQNNGTIAMIGGNVIGSTVTNAGTMTGFGGLQSVLNTGLIFVTNGTLQATASFTQNGTVNIAANTRLDVTPSWLNNGTILLNGGFTSGGTMTNTASSLLAGFGTISNVVVNAGTLAATNGTLTLVNALTQLGAITVANAATFNSVPSWQNGGFLGMLGGSVVGGALTNAGSITGFGTFSPSVLNNSGATITASGGGTLTLTAIPFQNGIVNILGTLNVTSAWSNGSAGTVSINGGVLTGGTFTVDGTVGGNGTIAANMIVGSGKTVTVSGGSMNLTALTTMNGGAINNGGLVNYGTVSGNGTIGSTLSNPGYVRATNGLLYVQALSGNQVTGTLEASAGGTLQANGVAPWLNNGHVILSGGTVIGGDISNNASHIISGYGTIAPNVYNSGQILANNANQALTLSSSLVNLSSGVVTANAGNLVVGGAFVNQGTLAMVHSMGTFASAVVNSGAWITDPTTNIFQDTYTATSSGYIQASAGAVYIFTNSGSHAASFVNQSAQSNTFNTVTAKFVFNATLSLTQTMYAAGSNIGNLSVSGGFAPELVGVAATNALSQFQNNFALGTLEIASTTEVADAAVDGGVDHDGLESALFVNELDLDPGAHLIISNDVQIYFITSNAFTSSQVTLLGDAGLHLLTSDASLVVPEPSVVLLWLSSIATIYAARRRAAARK
ncbi:MAG: autotransporter-associated beta strand repeat-containing protein [Verrucomicrobiia bacterium]